MAILRTLGVAGVGFAVALAVGEAGTPGSANKTVAATVNGVAPVAQGAGVVTGEVFRSAGPAVAGAKDALQTSGLGGLLDPTSTVPGQVAPARQPAPASAP